MSKKDEIQLSLTNRTITQERKWLYKNIEVTQ